MPELAVTVGDMVSAAAEVLARAGVDEPRREALELYALLVCGATSAAYLERDQVPGERRRDRFEEAVRRRAAGWPPQYAAGHANFRGHWLQVDPRVLIPRPETEGLVQLVADWAAGHIAGWPGGGWRGEGLPVAADIGTGSGAIAIALAMEARVAGVLACDVSADALNVALDNAVRLGAKERVAFRRGHLLEPLLDDPVEAIVSNPPYVATAEWEALGPGVKDHEPRLALDGGADGLGPTRALAAAARARLAPLGLLALEIDARRATESARCLMDAGFEHVEVRDDLYRRPRYAVGRRPEQA